MAIVPFFNRCAVAMRPLNIMLPKVVNGRFAFLTLGVGTAFMPSVAIPIIVITDGINAVPTTLCQQEML